MNVRFFGRMIVVGLLLSSMTACSSNNDRTTAQSDTRPQPTTQPNARLQPTATALNADPAQRPTSSVPTPTFIPAEPQLATNSASETVSVSGDPANPTIRLEDSAWQGSYRRQGGQTTYGGRTATWIYGNTTQYSTMTATFKAEGQPQGAAQLRIEGMDSEDRTKTPIQISVNGTEIFRGANPLPNDDIPLDSGTWTTATWDFDGALLKSGQNTISVGNLAPGQFSRPPFFMLDYAEISYKTQ